MEDLTAQTQTQLQEKQDALREASTLLEKEKENARKLEKNEAAQLQSRTQEFNLLLEAKELEYSKQTKQNELKLKTIKQESEMMANKHQR